MDVVARLRAAGCVFAEDEARLLGAAASGPAELAELVARRASGVPLEHVLGWAEFCGRRYVVAPGVFVPRRRSEFLVERAAARTGPGAVVLDLCCGCGALGAAVAAAVGGAQVHAVDADPAAVACARRNLAGPVVAGQVYQGDLYAPLPLGLLADTIVVVPPYVPSDAIRLMPPEARDHEPHAALDGGTDGLDVLRRVVREAPRWLRPGGHLLAETSADQAPAAVAAIEAAGLRGCVEGTADATIVIAYHGQ